jgi:hypothetical protein
MTLTICPFAKRNGHLATLNKATVGVGMSLSIIPASQDFHRKKRLGGV